MNIIFRHFKPLLFLAIALLPLAGCGKVTQTSSKAPDVTTFDLKYSVATISTADPTYKTSSPNYFTPSDSPAYTVVFGLGKGGKTQELSWGKAILSLKPSITASGNTVNSKVTALSKGDIEIDAADYTWSKLSFDAVVKQWSGDIKKIKTPYTMYLIAFYTGKGKAYLTILDSKRVSGNTTVTLPPITPYDTFIASLVLHDLQAQKGEIEATTTPGEFKLFFTEDFFETLGYKIPLTTATKFNPESPSFVFSREFEKRLLSLYELWKDNESTEGLSLIEKYKKDTPAWLSSKAEAWWIAKFKELSKDNKS